MRRAAPGIPAAPPQSPQSIGNTVRVRARARVTPITKDYGDCGGIIDLPGFDGHCSPDAALLALDLGQHTGWALRTAEGLITSGTVQFRQDRFSGGGMVFLRFRAWLQELDETAGEIGAVVFEEVVRHVGTAAGHRYGGWLAILSTWGEEHGIPYQGVPVGTIKRHVTGKGNAGKDEVLAAMRAKGFVPADDNEADALALLDWAVAHRLGGAR